MEPSSQQILEDNSEGPISHQFSDASDDSTFFKTAFDILRAMRRCIAGDEQPRLGLNLPRAMVAPNASRQSDMNVNGAMIPEEHQLGLDVPDEMVASNMLPHSALSTIDVWSVFSDSVSSICRFFPFEIDSTSAVPSTRFAVFGKMPKIAMLGMLFALIVISVIGTRRDYHYHHERKSSAVSDAPSPFPTAAPSPAPALPPSPAPHTDQRVDVIKKCASQLSGGKDAPPQQRAVNWFIDGAGLRIPEPTICEWDSPFGMLYALIVIRESLSVKDRAWQTAQPLNSATDACLWPRVRCQRGNVTELSFNNAMLEGTLPLELSGLVHLEELDMYTNAALAGPIPTEMGRMSSLIHWKIHVTRISGTVPTEIGNMKALKEFLLHETPLTGRMPQEVCDLHLDALVATCGIIDCPCCTKCKK